MALGWTSSRWSGITFLISKDNKPAPGELCFYWQVCIHTICLVNNIRLFLEDQHLKNYYLRFCFLNWHMVYFCLRLIEMISFLISLCQECQTLIDNHDQIKLLSNVRNNLNTTLKVGFYFLFIFNYFYLFIISHK